jgi:hypothetical protein
MAERETGEDASDGEAEARAQLERLDSLLSRMQTLRSKYAEALAFEAQAETPGSGAEWKQRYVRAMEAVHAPGGQRTPSRVRNRTDPIVPGSPGFRRDKAQTEKS